jgi:hypothetical protein
MQFGSPKDSFPCFTRLNPCVAHCSTDLISWVHHSREEGSPYYDGGFVRLQIHMNFDTNIHRQQCYVSNRIYLRVYQKKTFYELMHGCTPKVSHFHVFGCK